MREITIIDLWTDSNRGDNALQLSMIRMLRDRYPGVRITGVFRFGTNELDAARREIASTSAELDAVVGGIRRTYYAEANAGRVVGVTHAVVSLLSFLEALLCTMCFLALGARSRWVVGGKRYRSMRVVSDADVVVWKGKNFREYRGFTAVTRAMTLGGAGYFAGLLRGRIHCVNASFWSIDALMPRFLYRRAFRRCRSVTVRDRSSVANATALLGAGTMVRHCADLSFGLLADPASVAGAAPGGERGWDVALTVTAWGDEDHRQRYANALVAAINRLHALGATRFVVVPQVVRAAEDNAELVGELVARVRDGGRLHVDVIDGEPSIGELLTIYSRCRMLIGSRMHSCVFARSVGVPFVALAYDSGPKWEVLAAFWNPRFVLDYDADPRTVATACEMAWTDGKALIAASKAAWRSCVEGATDNVRGLDG